MDQSAFFLIYVKFMKNNMSTVICTFLLNSFTKAMLVLKRLQRSALSNGYAKKFKEARDKGEEFGTFSTDLSKAFDCIDHNVVTKLYWYRVTPKSEINFFLLKQPGTWCQDKQKLQQEK